MPCYGMHIIVDFYTPLTGRFRNALLSTLCPPSCSLKEGKVVWNALINHLVAVVLCYDRRLLTFFWLASKPASQKTTIFTFSCSSKKIWKNWKFLGAESSSDPKFVGQRGRLILCPKKVISLPAVQENFLAYLQWFFYTIAISASPLEKAG